MKKFGDFCYGFGIVVAVWISMAKVSATDSVQSFGAKIAPDCNITLVQTNCSASFPGECKDSEGNPRKYNTASSDSENFVSLENGFRFVCTDFSCSPGTEPTVATYADACTPKRRNNE